MSDTLVVNLHGGPGAGKSTLAYLMTGYLKSLGINAELAAEWVKGSVWEGRFGILDQQIYIFAKQLKRLEDLVGKVDIIITDSPLLLSIAYAKDESAPFRALVLEQRARFRNYDVELKRSKQFRTEGRVQKTVQEAQEIDERISELLYVYSPESRIYNGSDGNFKWLAEDIQARLPKGGS